MSQNTEQARSHWFEAARALKHLKRMVSAPLERHDEGEEPVHAWKDLRGALERLRSLISVGFSAAAEARPQPDPGLLRRKREIQTRSLRAQDALQVVESKAEALESERRRIISELEHVRDSWRQWREEANLGADELPEGTVDDLWGKLAALTAQWERLMSHQAGVLHESDRIESAWRWLLTVSFPVFETKSSLTSSASEAEHFHEQLKDIDHRWRKLRLRLKALAPIAGDETEKDASLEVQDSRIKILTQEILGLKSALNEARADAKRWQDIGEKASRDVERLLTTHQVKDVQVIRQLRDEISELERQRQADEKEFAGMRSAFEEARRLLKTHEDQAASARQAHQEVLERDAELKRGNAELERAIESLRREIADLNAKARLSQETLTQQSQTQHQVVERLTRELAAAVKAREELLERAVRFEDERRKAEEDKRKGEEEKRKAVVIEEAAFAQSVKLLEMEKASLLKEKNDLERRLKEAEDRVEHFQKLSPPMPQPAPTPAAAPAPEDAPLVPGLEPLLDPAWPKIIKYMGEHLSSAYARLRQLSGMSLGPGPLAVLKMAAASLVQASDAVKMVGEFFDETQLSSPAAARLEPILESALSAWEPALKGRHIELARAIEPGLPVISLQAEALKTAFYQALRNAYEAMPHGGKLAVKAFHDPASGEVRASFSDTGPGFPAELLADPFRPFAKAGRSHLGLGLALTRSLMRRMNGELDAANAPPPQKGALLTFRFGPPPGAGNAPPPPRLNDL